MQRAGSARTTNIAFQAPAAGEAATYRGNSNRGTKSRRGRERRLPPPTPAKVGHLRRRAEIRGNAAKTVIPIPTVLSGIDELGPRFGATPIDTRVRKDTGCDQSLCDHALWPLGIARITSQ